MESPVTSNGKVMHGTPCFAGTRVPVQTLYDWLEEGHSIEYFLEQFPSVAREQVLGVLKVVRDPSPLPVLRKLKEGERG
jgi:uncharacterized protein (DUF433 family)